MSEVFDTSPKKIWLGLTVPGKKMVAMFLPQASSDRRSLLIGLYEWEPSFMLAYIILALNLMKRGGPAFRYIHKSLRPTNTYDAILTDMRDFLKLRFGTKGLSEKEASVSEMIENGINARNFGETIKRIEPGLALEYAVRYTITSLDKLSRIPMESINEQEILSSLDKVIHLLSETQKWLYPDDYIESNR